MRKNLIVGLSLALTGALASPALAGGSSGSIGVGAEFTLGGIGGASVNYDAGMFHAGGFVGYYDADFEGDPDGADVIDIGGRFFYHLHSTAMSDFSVGAQLGFQNLDFPDPVDDATIVEIDLGAQIRAFVASNVAISGTLGIAILAADGDGFALTGDPLGAVGLHYYFF